MLRVAYHAMHGIDYFRFYDDSSIRNNSFAELEPWIRDGTVTIQPANIQQGKGFTGVMRDKQARENKCKHFAFQNGYDLIISLDLDEYLVPTYGNTSAIDQIWNMMTATGRYAARLDKMNFNSVPHLLEPVNLLTIEAYQHRMPTAGKMTYFKSVYPKSAIRLSGPVYRHEENRSVIEKYVRTVCSFHGCFDSKKEPWTNLTDIYNLFVSGAKKNEPQPPLLYHYSRSLEKFSLKARTWRTAGNGNAGYDLIHFMDRNIGWVLDNSAVLYGCQVREVLREKTRRSTYQRPGDFWLRNAEFQSSSSKLGIDRPYHYLGEQWPFLEEMSRIDDKA